MTSIVETIQQIVRHEMRALRVAELGVVEAILPHSETGDNANYGCDVRLRNTGLLLKRVPVMTGHLGSAAVPNIGDLVLLAFEKGDVNQGIVLGRLYTDDDRPPVNDANELVMHLPLHAADTAAVRTAIRNPSTGPTAREIIVEMAPKITVRITDGTVRVTAGNSELRLDQPDGGGGSVTATAGGTQITMAEDGSIAVQAIGDITLQSAGAISLSAAQTITLQAGIGINLEAGASLSFVAGAAATLEAGAAFSVQAPIIALGGLTTFLPG